MKKLLAMTLAMMSMLSAYSQRTVELLLRDNDNSMTTEEKLAAIHETDYTKNPAITAYIPKHPNGTAIVMCPGGGYTHQAVGHEGHDMAQWLNSLGITYIVLKYRLPQGHDDVPLSDAEEAIRLVRKHAAEWGVDPNNVGIAGASAGGHLATTLATHYSSPETRPDFQVLFYPVVSMDAAKTHRGSRDNLLGKNATEEQVKKFSNELQVTSDTPKAFIMLSSDDKAVPPANSIDYYTALVANGVPVSLHAYPSGGHGWGFRDSFPYKRQWTEELEKWLRDNVVNK